MKRSGRRKTKRKGSRRGIFFYIRSHSSMGIESSPEKGRNMYICENVMYRGHRFSVFSPLFQFRSLILVSKAIIQLVHNKGGYMCPKPISPTCGWICVFIYMYICICVYMWGYFCCCLLSMWVYTFDNMAQVKTLNRFWYHIRSETCVHIFSALLESVVQ